MKFVWMILGLLLQILILDIQESECAHENDDLTPIEDDKNKGGEADEDYPNNKKKGAEDEDKKKQNKENFFSFGVCKGRNITSPKSWIKAQKKCEPEKGKDGQKNSVCTLVCFWEKLEFFTGELKKLDQSAVDDFIDLLLTGSLENGRPAVKKEWSDCKQFIGDADDDDEKCKRHKKYFSCALKSLAKFCTTRQQQGIFISILGR